MDGGDYKNYYYYYYYYYLRIILYLRQYLIHTKNLSHLNSTFSASPVLHEVLTKHYNVQETVVLQSNDP